MPCSAWGAERLGDRNRHEHAWCTGMLVPMHILRPTTACVLSAAFMLGGCTQEDPEPPERTFGSSEWRESGSPGTTEYVALGDSYAAAPGVPTTDVNNDCFPSSKNHPDRKNTRLNSSHYIAHRQHS